MKRNMRLVLIAGVLALLALGVNIAGAQDPEPPPGETGPEGPTLHGNLGAGFTYQGHLTNGGSPVTGTCDFQFSLWDAATGGAQIGVTEPATEEVNNGLFDVELNDTGQFGSLAFTGDARWLQITVVSCPGLPGPVTLSPRVKLTATPYALSLKPGARVSGEVTGIGMPVFRADNSAAIGASDGIWGSTASSAPGVAGAVGRVTSTSPGSFSAGVRGINAGTGGLGIGVWGSQAGSGWGVYGTAVSGRGVFGFASAASGTNYGVYGQSASADGTGVFGVHSAAAGTAPGVHGETNSTASSAAGVVGRVTSTSPGSFSAGVRGINEGTGGLGIGVWGSQAGSGWGVYGTAVSGRGVYGAASAAGGAGVVARHAAVTGTALEINQGAIKVTGAGLGTSTAVFIHRAVAGNIVSNYTVIDHPLTNGDPNAILIVTPNWNPGGACPCIYDNHPIGVWYTGTGRWSIFNQDLMAMPPNAAFNVMVIKP